MGTLILLSIVLASIALPIRNCTRAAPRRALRSTQRWIIIYTVIWGVLCAYYYPRIVFLK